MDSYYEVINRVFINKQKVTDFRFKVYLWKLCREQEMKSGILKTHQIIVVTLKAKG